MNVEIVDLPVWRGGMLAAEYDAASDTARVNARAVVAIRRELGDAAAERFVACAIAHERAHRAAPRASEASVRDEMRAAYGDDAGVFEAVLRGASA